MKELKDRTLEVAICIEAIIILVLITIVVYFLTKNPYDVDNNKKVDLADVSRVYNYYVGTDYNKYDLNNDNVVDITDVLESNDFTQEIVDYILNEN